MDYQQFFVLKSLKEIVNKTNAHIVIHSSWRMYFDKTGSHYICKYMNDEFMKYSASYALSFLNTSIAIRGEMT